MHLPRLLFIVPKINSSDSAYLDFVKSCVAGEVSTRPLPLAG
jgi:hypothetical protein